MNASPTTWSIRRRVLAWLFAGMALVFTANLVIGYYGNREAADSAYDRLLLASASAIAERTAVGDDGLHVDIPYVALDMLASTAQDRVFYAVSAPDGTVVTGYEDLPEPPPTRHGGAIPEPQFYNATYKGVPIRVVAFRSFVTGETLSGFATVRVAQTRGERESLALTLLSQSAIWTLVIAVSGAVAAWLGISIGLRPLDRLGEALGRRSPEDVRPVMHDVPTEFKPLVGAVNGMLLRIDTGFSAMRRFISDASHQLKTPLAGLQTQTEMALRERDPEAVRQSLTKVDISVRRTSRLAQQLLSHARAAEPAGTFQDVDLAQVARDTVSMLIAQARNKEIDLGYEGEDSVVMDGDPTLLGEMAVNLADNALRYSPAGTMVTLSVARIDGTVTLTVDDQGPGIPEDKRDEVFERFVRLPGMSVEGCGLGLAIVREIAGRHGGQAGLERSPGGGLRVRIDFPVPTDGGPEMLRTLLLLVTVLVASPATAELVTFAAKGSPQQTLTIYSSADTERMIDLIDAFQVRNPGITVDYHLLDTLDIQRRAVDEMEAGRPTVDLLLSSAMDLQIKLVNDGYTQVHVSEETDALPMWANWRDEAFGFTYEPAVIIYNRALAPELEKVTTRFELARQLNFDVGYLRNRVVTYDPARSGLGFMFGTHDAIRSEDFWYLVRSLGDMAVDLETSSAAMINKVASGEALLAYNVLGSYAKARVRDNPDLAITIPSDYCLVMSRTAVIARDAENPGAAGLFIDFLLSRTGQQLIAGPASLYSLRTDIEGTATAASLRQEARGPLIPIHLGPGLLVYLDKLKRLAFLERWRRAMERK